MTGSRPKTTMIRHTAVTQKASRHQTNRTNNDAYQITGDGGKVWECELITRERSSSTNYRGNNRHPREILHDADVILV